ncbi:pyridine nucleotide-disulfide oxidoreductase [Candidatus Micrarchaeota archaeon]|nr:MAG: pyridine nucleotide-disulfide oxidoreductase [Candidatus Micrarchaeota archaeon]
MDYNIIIIGGGPAGITTALTAKLYYKDKRILLIKSIEKGVIPCAIPYTFKTIKPDEDALSTEGLEKEGIDVLVDEVVHVDRERKEVITKADRHFTYDKLVLATGSKAAKLPIEGIEKEGIFTIRKDMDYLKMLREEVYKANDVVIIGGGFIGVEMADELSHLDGLNVTIVELLPEILPLSFDSEFSRVAHEILSSQGVNIITGSSAKRFNGGERVESVLLSDGREIPAQVVIIGVGARPNADLAKDIGLNVNKGIVVDKYMRSSDKDIFAVGDCAEKKDFLTGKTLNVLLASTACAEARIAAANLFAVKALRENKGTVAAYSTKIGDKTFAAAGLIEKLAEKQNIDIVVGKAEVFNRHPSKLPGSSKTVLKLLFSKQSADLLGAELMGDSSAAELINILSLAIQRSVKLYDLERMQFATHPKLTASPVAYPIVKAAQDALAKLNSS